MFGSDTEFCTRHVVIGMLAAWVFTLASPAEDPFPDDHADSHIGATPVVPGVPVAGNIEIDVERDTFQFTTQKDKQLTVTVTPNSLWDASIRLLSSDGAYLIAETNSVGASQAELVFAHPAGAFTAYVEVEGFARWTEGTYDISVTAAPIVDSDSDSLPDVWEMQHFGSLAKTGAGDEDGDGASNRDEYLGGTDPNSAASRLRIVQIQSEPSHKVLTWSAAPLRDYAAQAVSSIGSTNWITLGVTTGVTDSASFTDTGSGVADERFYRIEVCD